MDVFANLSLGMGVALSPENLAFCFIGVRLGTLVGVLPGTLAVRLPIIAGLTLMAGNACLGSLSPRA